MNRLRCDPMVEAQHPAVRIGQHLCPRSRSAISWSGGGRQRR
jgi:hypothetical protein